MVVGLYPTQANFRSLLQRIRQWWTLSVLAHSATLMLLPIENFDYTNVATDQGEQPKWNVTLNKPWNWSISTKLAVSTSWSHGLITESLSSVVVGLIPLKSTFYSYFKECFSCEYQINIYIYIYIYVILIWNC